MKQIVALAVLLLCTLGVTVSQAADMSMHMHDGPPVPNQYGKQFENFASEMNVGMAKMMMDMHAPGYTGDPDIDFLEMMIPHHEGAVDMARLVLEHGTDPITRKLAEEIIGSQRVEIEGMQRRLKGLRQGASRTDPGGYPALGGTRGDGSSAQKNK
jgi:uncharacterized protein (DUF305 family)